MNKKIFLLLIVITLTSLSSTAFTEGEGACFDQRDGGCKNNMICDTTTCIDLLGNREVTYSNCRSCGTTTTQCPIGMAACENTCIETLTGASCQECTPNCEEIQFTEPTYLLYLNVFTKKDFIITADPEAVTALAGRPMTYHITIKNLNPIDVNLGLDVTIPPGWTADYPTELSLQADTGSKEFDLTVTSNESSAEGTYDVTVAVYSQALNLFGSSTFKYSVSTHQSPAIVIDNPEQDGVIGSEISYNITITNNDPPTFDPSTFRLETTVPYGWTARFSPSSLNIAPGESKSTMFFVTSSSEAELGQTEIKINISTSSLTVSKNVYYNVVLCGNHICELGEENTCPVDCQETYFVCNGRCERETDTGIEIRTSISGLAFTKFLVCSYGASPGACEADFDENDCGFGKSCLCGNSATSSCSFRCVDEKSIYYMATDDASENFVTSANYTFTCPWVNLPEIIKLRDDFSEALDDYEMSRSAMKESIDTGTQSEKASLMPCYNALGFIISKISEHVEYLDDVIDHPSKSNTTEARRKTNLLKTYVSSFYNTKCLEARGILTIESVSPPTSAVIDETATARIVVKNTESNTGYYSYLECDFTDPSGETSTVTERCAKISAGQTKTFSPSIEVTTLGDWSMSCKVYGSLQSDCSRPELHDMSESLTFNVYTNDVYVMDIKASECVNNRINSTVRISAPRDCVWCDINDYSCSFIRNESNNFYFNCFGNTGNNIIRGYVLSTPDCDPVEPVEKSITVRCPMCGDGILDADEDCEPPNTLSNTFCVQTDWTCDYKRFGVREPYGFCTPNCQCSPVAFTYSCDKEHCGAECSDGETKDKTITTDIGSCVCIQQCGRTCGWEDCSCEPPEEYFATITSRLCTYNPDTELYDVSVDASWYGGEGGHAIIIIEETATEYEYTLSPFTRSKSFSSSGWKNIQAVIYDETNSLLTQTDIERVYCEP
ncbi:MAG: COG1470 family protein, partial [Candidatus Baldrarchaeia archaeon]